MSGEDILFLPIIVVVAKHYFNNSRVVLNYIVIGANSLYVHKATVGNVLGKILLLR